jgi:hypothetical protein
MNRYDRREKVAIMLSLFMKNATDAGMIFFNPFIQRFYGHKVLFHDSGSFPKLPACATIVSIQ